MNNLPKIQLIFSATSSMRDTNGNCYHSVRLTDTMSGATVASIFDTDKPGEIMSLMDLNWDNIFVIEREFPKKQFKGLTKQMPHKFAHELIADLKTAIEAKNK